MSLDNLAPVDPANPAPELNTPPNAPEAPPPVDPAAPPPAPEKPAVQPDWPEDWRQKIAKGDAKVMARLERFPSPPSLWDSFRNIETKLSGGKFKPDLPENATPEQLAEYRKAVGVPEKAEGYFEKLPEGLVIGEEDKAAMTALAERLHAKNATPDLVAEVIDTYYKMVEENQAEAVEANKAYRVAAQDELRQEYGAEFRSKINMLNNWMSGLPEGVGEYLENSVGPDGMLLLNNTGFVRHLIGQIQDWNPASTVVPAGSGNQSMAINDELAQMDKEMRENISAWQAPANASRRARHVQLLEAQEKMAKR